MTAVADPDAEKPAKSSKMPLILGLVFALVGGGGGFMAVQMGLIGGGQGAEDHAESDASSQSGDDKVERVPVAFVELDPLIVSLPSNRGPRFMRFAAQLEVVPGFEEEVTEIKPRIVDVLNGYLRAVEIAELENPASLVRLRGQMLRRIQVVAGKDRVKDLLIMEFVIN